MGFIPGRNLTDNILCTLNVIHYGKLNKIQSIILAADIKKAFDSLETSYLSILLQAMGFSQLFLNAIKAIYKHSEAQVRIINVTSY